MAEPKFRDRLLSIREVEERVGLKQAAIYAWMKTGRFPPMKILGPRTVRWSMNEIDGWQNFQATEGSRERAPEDHLLSADTILRAAQPMRSMKSGIYFLIFDQIIVYVGKSRDVMRRIKEHIGTKEFDAWHWIPCSMDELSGIERSYINKFMPELNRDVGTIARRNARLAVVDG